MFSFFILFSCKEKDKTSPKAESLSKTYAEISIKEGGIWKENIYEGGQYTNVNKLTLPEQHTDHSNYIRYEGPGWENKQVAYRLYSDWRNAIDIFGKKVDSIVLPYVGQPNTSSYHEPSKWGQDILKAGNSLGLGGFGRLVNDTVVHFKNTAKTDIDVQNTNTSSSVNLMYKNWITGADTINLKASLTIYPTDRYTKVTLTPSYPIANICTGIVLFEQIPLLKKQGAKWGYIATYGTQTLAKETDQLGMALFYKLEEATLQKGTNDHLVVFKPLDNITYYFLAAWDQEKNGIQNKDGFMANLNKTLQILDNNNALPN